MEGTLGGLMVALRVLPIPWKLEARPFCQHVRSRLVDAGAKYNSCLRRVRGTGSKGYVASGCLSAAIVDPYLGV